MNLKYNLKEIKRNFGKMKIISKEKIVIKNLQGVRIVKKNKETVWN